MGNNIQLTAELKLLTFVHCNLWAKIDNDKVFCIVTD